MATTQISDVVVPASFTEYVVQETMEKTALIETGVILRNPLVASQLRYGADTFTVPSWNDLGNQEADLVNDDPDEHSVPQKLTAIKQRVRKSYLHASWSAMNMASELAGSDALRKVQNRVTDYWNRQFQKRIVASFQGMLAANVAVNSGDMAFDISTSTGDAAQFSSSAVIDTAATLGDAASSLSAIFMHSHVYTQALKNDDIEYVPSSDGRQIATYRGMAVVVDDGMPSSNGSYVTVLAGTGAISFGMAAPMVADATAIEVSQSAGNGGGMQVLHTRFNVAVHPLGFDWVEGTLAEASPSIADLRLGAHWNRVVERKAVPLAFLISK